MTLAVDYIDRRVEWAITGVTRNPTVSSGNICSCWIDAVIPGEALRIWASSRRKRPVDYRAVHWQHDGGNRRIYSVIGDWSAGWIHVNSNAVCTITTHVIDWSVVCFWGLVSAYVVNYLFTASAIKTSIIGSNIVNYSIDLGVKRTRRHYPTWVICSNVLKGGVWCSILWLLYLVPQVQSLLHNQSIPGFCFGGAQCHQNCRSDYGNHRHHDHKFYQSETSFFVFHVNDN